GRSRRRPNVAHARAPRWSSGTCSAGCAPWPAHLRPAVALPLAPFPKFGPGETMPADARGPQRRRRDRGVRGGRRGALRVRRAPVAPLEESLLRGVAHAGGLDERPAEAPPDEFGAAGRVRDRRGSDPIRSGDDRTARLPHAPDRWDDPARDRATRE